MRQLVVGAAIVRADTVLAARRTTPSALAGRWEFPGGKVESGEDPAAALVREIAEELGCGIAVETWLDDVVDVGERHELRVAVCRLVTGDPRPLEHDAIRWLTSERLSSIDWLEPDRPFLDQLRALLASSPPRPG